MRRKKAANEKLRIQLFSPIDVDKAIGQDNNLFVQFDKAADEMLVHISLQ